MNIYEIEDKSKMNNPMHKLARYELDYLPTYAYFFDRLDQVNEFSKQVISLIDFKSGRFFTIFENNAQQNLYDFKYAVPSYRTAIKSENLIFDIVSSDNRVSIWFDDFESSYEEGYDEAIFLEYGVYYEKQIYYQMTKETITKENLKTCFNYSNTIWHSLCLLAKTKILPDEKKITLEQIKQICSKTQLMLICAYDADGYVFWERSNEYDSFISNIIF